MAASANVSMVGSPPPLDAHQHAYSYERRARSQGASPAKGGHIDDDNGDLPRFFPFTDEETDEEDVFVKTLVPTSEMIESLQLDWGKNTVTFSVNSLLQGVQEISASIYLWKPDTKIVISDVDGTITKSDILGNIMPLMGKDWSHRGVTDLYSNITKNGYQMLYLTSRAIGQAQVTRRYLTNVTQNDTKLPEGPVVMSPDRLIKSFKREVIDRRPQEFKIAALSAVRDLFAADHNPFYAGFGNRDTDVVAYTSVGVPKSRIFVINPTGQIGQQNSSAYSKSYTLLNEQVNSMFPARSDTDKFKREAEYNAFNFWRAPLPEIELPENEA